MRSDLFDQRRALMDRWAEFVTGRTDEEESQGQTEETEAEAEKGRSGPG